MGQVSFGEMFSPSPIKGLWSELRGVESEGGGVRRRGRGKCPEVGAGRDFPGAAGSEVSAGAGSGCRTGRWGRGAGGAGEVGPWRPRGGWSAQGRC